MDDNDVRIAIYGSFVDTGRPPMPVELAAALGAPLRDVEEALHRLADSDVIALVPGTTFVWLAHPFSAAAAPFRVTGAGRSWDAICIWDALGILALLETDGTVETSCPDCGETLQLSVTGDAVAGPPRCVVHFGVPAARWYEDVGYT